ncbi:endospore germination permease [Clostridium aestuarii]|uniref:Endospore germination permease n=1 Tax=Clostridium aestuarii TaxID=338193 RepID=A0ABT4D0F2_9CLOT|nr:endospore germination permease [Clostridium aestuarii]MCY6484714.1 endospore germination permease [Clostridium aestuarii]
MKEYLTNIQIFFILVISVTVHDSMELAKEVAEVVGTDGWITILLGMVISIFFTYIITYLGSTFRGKTLEEYSNIIVGKFFTNIFIIIYIIYFFLVGAFLPQIGCEFLRLEILEKTPRWTMVLALLLVVYYTICKGLRVIGRLFEFYGFIIIMATIFIPTIMFTQGRLINIQPLVGSVDKIQYVKGLEKVIPYIGIELLMIIPFEKNNSKILKYTISAILLSGFIFLLAFEACISILGVDDIIYYKDALFVAVRRVDVPYLEFFQRIDGIFISIWFMALIAKTCIYIYATVYLLKKIFKKVEFKYIGLVVIVLACIIGKIPKTFESQQKLFQYAGYMSILTGVIIPLILFSIAKVKKYDKKIV